MTTTTQIREPWPDEIPRVQHFLPFAFLSEPNPFLLIAVSGRVERIIGALSLSLRPLASLKSGWLSMRVENDDPCGAILIERGLRAAWMTDARRVYFAQSFEEDSAPAKALQAAGFEVEAVHQVYEMNSREIFERLDRIYQRLRARNLIPANVEITTLLPAVMPKAREFLVANLPQNASIVAIENAGFKAEHSYALFVDGKLKGVLLTRRVGNTSRIGLRVVSPDLRGRFGWANLVLLHAATRSGVQTGLEKSTFEFNPDEHQDTSQFAHTSTARFIGRRLLFSIMRPIEWS